MKREKKEEDCDCIALQVVHAYFFNDYLQLTDNEYTRTTKSSCMLVRVVCKFRAGIQKCVCRHSKMLSMLKFVPFESTRIL